MLGCGAETLQLCSFVEQRAASRRLILNLGAQTGKGRAEARPISGIDAGAYDLDPIATTLPLSPAGRGGDPQNFAHSAINRRRFGNSVERA
mgnify:CR=1 FL=1